MIHLPTTVGGNPQGISRHLRELGLDSQSWTIQQNFLAYPADKVIVSKNDHFLSAEWKKLQSLRYVFICDLVFFNFGTGLYTPFVPLNSSRYSFLKNSLLSLISLYHTIMSFIEVGLLRLRSVPIFIQYQGDDARQGDYSRKNFRISIADRVDDSYYSDASDDAKRRRINYYDRVSNKIYALNPDLLHVLPGRAEFLPYSHINLNEWQPKFNQLEDRPLRIGHAPSHRSAKGTDIFLQACEELKNQGYNFEVVLVEGVSNSEAKEIYQTIDLLVDQLFSGWYGGLAVEVMALGKPVVVYIREEDLKFIPLKMKESLPFIRTEPDLLLSKMKEILELPRNELYEIALKSRQYVEDWHNPVVIAERIKSDIEDMFSDSAKSMMEH